MNAVELSTSDSQPGLEVTLGTALEMCRLGMGTMIDVRQSFEIEMKGAIPDTVHIPMFEVKVMLGDTLTDDEQDILDAGQPKDIVTERTVYRWLQRQRRTSQHAADSGAAAAESRQAGAFRRPVPRDSRSPSLLPPQRLDAGFHPW